MYKCTFTKRNIDVLPLFIRFKGKNTFVLKVSDKEFKELLPILNNWFENLTCTKQN